MFEQLNGAQIMAIFIIWGTILYFIIDSVCKMISDIAMSRALNIQKSVQFNSQEEMDKFLDKLENRSNVEVEKTKKED